jgi:hypothetical protein
MQFSNEYSLRRVYSVPSELQAKDGGAQPNYIVLEDSLLMGEYGFNIPSETQAQDGAVKSQ